MEAASPREIQAGLQRKSGFEVLDLKESASQLRVMGRQPRDRMGMNVANWLLVVRSLLQRSGQAGWSVDVSKHHFLRGEQVIYSWRLIFQSDVDIKAQYSDILKAILASPHTTRGEITEMPLAGASKDRNSNGGVGRGRGAVGSS